MNLKNIFPTFSLDMFTPNNAEDLSALFILVLLLFFFYFIVKSLMHYYHALLRVRWVREQIHNDTIETVLQNRNLHEDRAQSLELSGKPNSIIKRIIQGNQVLAAASWLEFNETLVETRSARGSKLNNTLDASYFFNTRSLAGGITESRMLAAVPGFLTALGVIGTFFGLQLGLSELNLGGDFKIKEMKEGLNSVISGASIAFMTSIWGVFLSVAFNIFEKSLEKGVRSRIFSLQNRIDRLYPRLSAESQLQRIADDGNESRDSLQGLAEQIGTRMQESLVQVTDGISQALSDTMNSILAPALDNMMNNASDSGKQVMQELVQEFMDKMGEAGSGQRAAMDESTAKMNSALDGMQVAMSSLVSNLQNNQDNLAKRDQELIQKISGQVDSLVQGANEQQKNMADLLENQLSTIAETSLQQQQNSNQREEQRDKRFEEQTSALSESTQQLLSHLKTAMEDQINSGKSLLAQGEALRQGLDKSTSASEMAASSIKESSDEMRNVSDRLSGFGLKIQQASDTLSGSVTEAAETTSELSSLNQQAMKSMQELRDQLLSNTNQFEKITADLDGLMGSSSTLFQNMKEHQTAYFEDLTTQTGNIFTNMKENQEEYIGALDQNVVDLSKKVAESLKDYAEQANGQAASHLNIWAQHTSSYSEKMNALVSAIQNVVDEIETKSSKLV